MNRLIPSSDDFHRIDAIKATLAKIRLRMKAHKAIDLHQINEMSEEVLSALRQEDIKKQNDNSEIESLRQKGAFVQANLEKMREIIWEEDRQYLHQIYQIIFTIDELTYAIPFHSPSLIEEKLEEIAKDLAEVIQKMTYFSPRVEEKIQLAYDKLKHIHFLSYHPISQELITFSYFPNFAQNVRQIAELFKKGELEQADKLFSQLSERQREELFSASGMKKKVFSDKPEEKASLLEKFLLHLDTLFLTAKEIFYGDEKMVKEQLKRLDKKSRKYVEQYLWRHQENEEPLNHKATLGIINYIDEIILS